MNNEYEVTVYIEDEYPPFKREKVFAENDYLVREYAKEKYKVGNDCIKVDMRMRNYGKLRMPPQMIEQFKQKIRQRINAQVQSNI